MLSNRFASYDFVQIILHDGITESCGNICRSDSLCGSGRNGSLDKYRTTFPKIRRCFCRKGKRAKLSHRNSHACRLFLNKTSGSGCADLIHLKICYSASLKMDIFAVLTADFKNCVRLWHTVYRTSCLRSNLIPDGVRPDHAPDAFSSRSGHTDGTKLQFSKAFPNV